MTSTLHLKLYELFLPLVKQEVKAKSIVQSMEALVEQRFAIGASKEDIRQLRTELQEGMAHLRIEIKEQRAETLKWSLVFWAGQFAAIIAVAALLIGK